MELKTSAVEKMTCRRRLKGLSWKKYSVMTSRQTKASRGRVVNMLRPKHRRAMFTMMLSVGKLLSTLPCVKRPKVRKPDSAIIRQATMEMKVE